MYTGGMLCQDCHGNMTQVGNDFSKNMPGGSFVVANDFYTTDATEPLLRQTPRVPWANEPGCGSCHIGDAENNGRSGLNTSGTLTVNVKDKYGSDDNLRLRQAYTSVSYCDADSTPPQDPANCPKMTPIVPSNKRFAEVTVGGGTPIQAPAGNPKLYRVSTGHSDVMCEGCHGSTHAEWPNANPNDNLTATQLQGHAGLISECSVCHTNEWDNTPTLNGPHGLHPIGANAPFANRRVHGGSDIWGSGGYNDATYQAKCQACHGGASRSTSTGTVLSRTFAERTLKGNPLAQGTPVACPLCHKR